MRWRFPDPNDARESELRTQIYAAIDAWWDAFGKVERDLAASFGNTSPSRPLDIAGFMRDSLQRIDRRLTWEFGPGRQPGGHRLVITPEAHRSLRPLVDAILARAPSLPPWEFYAHRLPENLEQAARVVSARTGVDIDTLEVEVRRGELHGVDLTWFVPPDLRGSPRTTFDAEPDDAWRGAAFIATEALLGEEVLDTWIGLISVQARPRPGLLERVIGGNPLDGERDPGSLRRRVESLIAGIHRDLPAQPQATSALDGNGVLFELQPTEAADYAAQTDLFVSGSRGLAEMWRAAHVGVPFSSRRFSRHGEIFCYLKIDGADGKRAPEGAALADRSALQDALDATLRPRGLGAVIGGGSGLRYSYIDLALLRLDRGLAEVRQVAREARLPHRTWLLFFDAEWQAEWIGIYDDTPPPPRG